MGHILTTLLHFVLIYKYPALFVITFLGAFALPLPSGSVVMAAAAFSDKGYFNINLVFLVCLAGNLAGDNCGYWLVRKYGLGALKRIKLGWFFSQKKLGAARQKLSGHPFLTIYSTRFFTSIAPAINAASGLSRVPYKQYLLFEFLGELTEVTMFCALGYFLGSNWEKFGQFPWWAWVLSGAVVSLIIWQIILRKK